MSADPVNRIGRPRTQDKNRTLGLTFGSGPLKIELLHVPGCANVEMARRVLQSALLELGLDASVVEREGAYPSPTILVDGRDVVGKAEADGASCRLDVPTRERVVAALESASEQRT